MRQTNARFYRRYYQNIAPILKNRKTQAYTMVILSLFAISFFGFFAIRPTLKTIATLQKQIEDRSLVDQKLEDKINALIAAQEEYRRAEPILPAIYGLLPEKAEITSLLIQLENLVDNRSSTVSAISFEPIVLYGEEPVPVAPNNPATGESLQNVLSSHTAAPSAFSFSVTFSGPYRELVNILSRLTKLDRIVTINSAEFSLASSQTAISQLTVNMKTQAYYFSGVK